MVTMYSLTQKKNNIPLFYLYKLINSSTSDYHSGMTKKHYLQNTVQPVSQSHLQAPHLKPKCFLDSTQTIWFLKHRTFWKHQILQMTICSKKIWGSLNTYNIIICTPSLESEFLRDRDFFCFNKCTIPNT